LPWIVIVTSADVFVVGVEGLEEEEPQPIATLVPLSRMSIVKTRRFMMFQF